ncbi:GNAT family N-acetyltransferase [Veronia nyctiphanis]|uniref:GNAT family N-acetyltransferase n=1 Tax=Veronia nyctiphanis TaxID=1278244 RepID=A0A4Q0YTS2_9GAMM|nr:GNAT family N-acetyltransferase [Veronia nyctiphanis]RXJ74656.1 GNAT family N-acetyltransferase [Veronia nyctiphanis]
MKANIYAERVFLRQLTADDTDDLMKTYGNPLTMEFGSDPVFTSTAMVSQLLKSMENFAQNHASYEWGIVTQDTGEVIGTCGFHSFSPCRTECEVGCLLNSEFWRQGYMSEALSVLFSHAKSLGVERLFASIDPNNYRSIGLFCKLGFTIDHQTSRFSLCLGR